jgi:hypothetical protein
VAHNRLSASQQALAAPSPRRARAVAEARPRWTFPPGARTCPSARTRFCTRCAARLSPSARSLDFTRAQAAPWRHAARLLCARLVQCLRVHAQYIRFPALQLVFPPVIIFENGSPDLEHRYLLAVFSRGTMHPNRNHAPSN